MLAYKKGWKIIDDSYAFSNAIRLIVFLVTWKLVKFNKTFFVSSKYDPEEGYTTNSIP